MPLKRPNLHRWVAALRKRFPLPFPLRVRFKRLPDHYGYADLLGEEDGKYFVIVLDAALSEQLALQFLAHEYAHCLRWDFRHEYGDANWHGHDAAWGVHHAEVYRFIFDGE